MNAPMQGLSGPLAHTFPPSVLLEGQVCTGLFHFDKMIKYVGNP